MKMINEDDLLKLKNGLNAVRELIENSSGVAGLHKNGDVASWDSLLAGGSFGGWLSDFSDAIDLIDNFDSQ